MTEVQIDSQWVRHNPAALNIAVRRLIAAPTADSLTTILYRNITLVMSRDAGLIPLVRNIIWLVSSLINSSTF